MPKDHRKGQKPGDRAKAADQPAKTADGRRGPGRPTVFDRKRHVRLATLAAALGATQAESATILGVSASTVKTWRKQYPEFADALGAGRMRLLARVAGKLHRAALGGARRTSEKTVVAPGGRRTETVVERMAPSWRAALAILERRMADRWGPQATEGGAEDRASDILAAVAKMKAGLSEGGGAE